jgi:hypothetical protein
MSADRSPHTESLPPSVTCPFCGGRDTRPLATFGSLLMTSQYYCAACRTPFEWLRRESDTPRRESNQPRRESDEPRRTGRGDAENSRRESDELRREPDQAGRETDEPPQRRRDDASDGRQLGHLKEAATDS